ncbi:Pyruvate/2-oxoglutarate dehydrogenase complex, dihydrolipoamide dehydrogenase (E3) component [Saccharopolyspora shandongensis]|uniref:Pyruvate/2-oxoglutarate dehydrogenase complex, dihydrolipoamide dehydrogenase (E3) component n=1 Tax=Saccharopolyspora shandongensis TaxID=418495 RepID=A0A1H3U8D5_9PSEU|nr:NAD(P)/FAD-dependent oxidoreductase [Saccharopolyspora shandongensis]SDZ57819.1 Pyruvate/2-oxoglutarate dehydrogenase complex, dihydrolipoamide dehydrogenase (E3) component [Saccharopolyspora shandongensis]
MSEQTDVVVVGLGPGGEHVAGTLAEAGLDVVAVEAELVGGECPYWGCVPSKMMIRAGNLLAEARRVPGIAGDASVRPDWGQVAARIRGEATDDWNDQVAADRLTGKGARLVRGFGRLTGPRQVTVDGRTFQARRGVVLATGSRPRIPPIPGLAETPYWTNRDAVAAKELPASLTVLGGGAIGVEIAQVFARFGCRVTVVEGQERLLSAEEPESGRLAADVLQAEGATVRTSVRAERVSHDGAMFTVHLGSGESVGAEQLLVATGRRVELAGLGVDAVGIDPAAAAVDTDGRMRVGDGLWAVGDITGRGAFTHVSMYQAQIAIRDILGFPGPDADYRALPRVVFTDPEIGAVGLTEQAARDRGLQVRTSLVPLSSATRGWIHKAGNEGFVKLVQDLDRGVLVGATSVGAAGGEVLYGLGVAVHAEVPVERLRNMIYAYPTFHRTVEAALAALG